MPEYGTFANFDVFFSDWHLKQKKNKKQKQTIHQTHSTNLETQGSSNSRKVDFVFLFCVFYSKKIKLLLSGAEKDVTGIILILSMGGLFPLFFS